MSMTIGPRGRIVSVFSILVRKVTDKSGEMLAPERSLLRRFLFDHDLRSVLKFPADRAVASGDHFVALLNAALDFHGSIVGDSGCHFDHLCLVSVLNEHNLR